jgi:hypothetical protein
MKVLCKRKLKTLAASIIITNVSQLFQNALILCRTAVLTLTTAKRGKFKAIPFFSSLNQEIKKHETKNPLLMTFPRRIRKKTIRYGPPRVDLLLPSKYIEAFSVSKVYLLNIITLES